MTNSKSLNITRNEEIFDAILKIAAKEAFNDEMTEIFEEIDEMEDIEPSEILEKKIRNMISKEKRVNRRKRFLRSFMKVAAVFLAVVGIGSIGLISVEASRNFILNLLIDIRGDYVLIELGRDGIDYYGGRNISQDDTEMVDGFEVLGIVFGYVPVGFEVVSYQEMGSRNIVIFSDSAGGRVVINQNLSQSTTVIIDTEFREFKRIYLSGGQEAFLFTAVDYNFTNALIWQIGNDAIYISSTTEVDDMLRMSENISIQ